MGQVYLPVMNALLLLATVGLVLTFQKSENLAHAYGLAVNLQMALTTVMVMAWARRGWGWSLGAVVACGGAFLLIELLFLASNTIKILHGGFITIAICAVLYLIMTTWRWGRGRLRDEMLKHQIEPELFVAEVANSRPYRFPRVAVFLSGNPRGTPTCLLHNYRHNGVVHQTTILLTVTNESTPTVPESSRSSVENLGQGFFRVILRCGFSETVDVAQALKTATIPGVRFDPHWIAYFLGRETLRIRDRDNWWQRQRKRLFVFLSKHSHDATNFYGLPPNQVVEIGVQMVI
jgi:KUP system potassium uptake protein